MKNLRKRVFAAFLAVLMTVTFVQLPAGSQVAKADENSKYVTLHFYNTYGWEKPALQYWQVDGTTVSDETGSGEITDWGGAIGHYLTEDTATGEGWYKITLKGSFEGFQFLDYATPSNCTGGICPNEIKYCISDEPRDLYLKWGASTSNTAYWYLDPEYTTSIDTLIPADAFTTQTVTMHYKADASAVNGYITQGSGWSKIEGYDYVAVWPGESLTKDSANEGWFTFTVTMPADQINVIFNYADGQTDDIKITPETEVSEYWFTGLKDSTDNPTQQLAKPEGWVDSEKNELTKEVPSEIITYTIYYHDADDSHLSIDAADIWAWNEPGADITNGAFDYTEKVVLADGKTWLKGTVTTKARSIGFKSRAKGTWDSWQTENHSVTVPETADKAEVYFVNGDDKTYFATPFELIVNTYTVYYHDENEAHMSTTDTDLWGWEVNGSNLFPAEGCAFTELVTLSDGNKWLKAQFTTTARHIGLIPRSNDAWTWKTSDHFFDLDEGAASGEVYIVFGDEKTYSTLPTIKVIERVNVLVDYTRVNNDYDNWNIFSWTTGFGNSTEIYAEDLNGRMIMTVPVTKTSAEKEMSFCMRLTTTTEEWANKDGGDHNIHVNPGQDVVKAFFEEGKGVVRVLPDNTGYELKGAEGKICFYYRDDELMLTNNEASLEGKVSIVVGKADSESRPATKAMTYDAVNERYVYEMPVTESGVFNYYYVVDGVQVADRFNANTQNGISSVTFKTAAGGSVSTGLSKETINSRENVVLGVEIGGLAEEEIASATADLSELGLGLMAIDPEARALSISVKDTVLPGEKNIPVEIKDIYGNIYKANATITVTAAPADSFDWDEAVIYFAVTDRFFDGSTENNEGVNKNESLSYHGGDFVGLTEKLDYLQDLGVNTIWITPIVSNMNTTYTDEASGEVKETTGFHGYWADDFTKLNSHLGNEDEFAALISEAHKRGMKLMVDVVVNHAGYDTQEYFNSILTDEQGEAIKMIRDESNTISGDYVYDSLSDLPDFVTENDAVRQQIIKWQTDWVAKYGIDYFRVDTVKHVDKTTWSEFKNALTEINPEFKMIGEYAGFGYSGSGVLGNGMMDSVLDFDFNNQAEEFAAGKITAVENFLTARNAGINNTATVGQFLSSHDEDAFAKLLVKEKNFTEEEAANAAKVAAALQITAKGQPIIYYGEEIGQYGENNWPVQSNRNDLNWTEVEAQSKDADSVLAHYKKLLAIRNANTKVFAKGTRTTLKADDAAGIDVFERSYNGTSLVVALNIKNEAQQVTLKDSRFAGKILKDLYGNSQFVAAADGTVTVTIPASSKGGTAIFSLVNVPSSGSSTGSSASGNDQGGSEITVAVPATQQTTTRRPAAVNPLANTEVTQETVEEAAQDTVETQEDTVVADANDTAQTDTTVIEDEQAALAGGTAESAMTMNLPLIGIVALVLIILAAGGIILIRKKEA